MIAASGATPMSPASRIGVLDALRGAALFGVFLVNFVVFANDLIATEAQMDALTTRRLDGAVRLAMNWLVTDKANTLFAFLFGVGFALQRERLLAAGADFNTLYLRRLVVLLLMGVGHLVFVFTLDILHLYALAGLALYAMRNLTDRTILVTGLLLAVGCRWLVEALAGFSDVPYSGEAAAYFGDAAAATRQALSLDSDYAGLVRHFAAYFWYDMIVTASAFGWLGYSLGRFLLGKWTYDRGILTEPAAHAGALSIVARRVLPAGLLVALAVVLLRHQGAVDSGGFAEVLLNLVSEITTLAIAAGYVSLFLMASQTASGWRLLSVFAPVGRMALTNYLLQSVLIGFVLFDLGAGLGLGGRIGSLAVVAFVVTGFALQVVFSLAWLHWFRFGPAEWLWRALTYGTLPNIRRAR